MKPMLERVRNGEVIVADGAMGTMLFGSGLKPGECPERLNLDKPQILEEVARKYQQAGAEIIQTNTFGGSALKLADFGLADRTEAINKRAAEIVRSVVGNNAYVSGSVGPSGKMLVPFGDTEPEALYESFKRQISGLLEGGVDVLCIETMTDLQEITQAIKAARDLSADIPLMTTMTFDPTPNGFFTMMGVGIARAAQVMEDNGADIVGSNCGNGLENMIRIAIDFRQETGLPIIIQSNAGIPENREGRLHYPEDPEFFARKTNELIDAGVLVIGGCCGTTPEHIAAIRKTVDGRANRK